jgi:hypothetical protein
LDLLPFFILSAAFLPFFSIMKHCLALAAAALLSTVVAEASPANDAPTTLATNFGSVIKDAIEPIVTQSPELLPRQAPKGQAPKGQAPKGQAPKGQAPKAQAPAGQAPAGQASGGRGSAGNPFQGYSMYANNFYASEVISTAIPSLADKSLAAKASAVAKVPSFFWMHVSLIFRINSRSDCFLGILRQRFPVLPNL